MSSFDLDRLFVRQRCLIYTLEKSNGGQILAGQIKHLNTLLNALQCLLNVVCTHIVIRLSLLSYNVSFIIVISHCHCFFQNNYTVFQQTVELFLQYCLN